MRLLFGFPSGDCCAAISTQAHMAITHPTINRVSAAVGETVLKPNSILDYNWSRDIQSFVAGGDGIPMTGQWEIVVRLGSFGGIMLLLTVWELIAPRRPLSATKAPRWASNLGLVAMNAVLARLTIPLTAVVAADYCASRGWGMLHLVNWPFGLEVVIAVLALDFVIYLQHVLFHAVPALWRLHMVHHADLDIDVTTGLRFHTFEILLSAVIKLAAVLLIGPAAIAVVVFEVLLNATSMFNHSNVRMPGWLDSVLRWIVVTPDMHRVHHSVIRRETNSNFGFNLPWWDYWLGTYRAQPQQGHAGMTIGLANLRDESQVDRLLRMLLLPFQKNAYGASRSGARPGDEKSRDKDDAPPGSGQHWGPKLFLGLLIATAIGISYWQWGDVLGLQHLAQHESQLRAFQREHPVLVYGLAFLLYLAVTAFSFPGATVLTLIYGWYFGFVPALILVSISSTAGATTAFLLSRYLFQAAIMRRFGARLEKFNQTLEQDGLFYLFTLRLLPAVPFFVINAVMGLTPIRTRDFWWVSQLGMVPGTALYVFAGSSVPNLQTLAEQGVNAVFTTRQLTQLMVAFIALGIFPLLVRGIVKFVARRTSESPSVQPRNKAAKTGDNK